MSDVLNGSFEDGAAGVPDFWDLDALASTYMIADFGDGSGAESFESGWSNTPFVAAFTVGTITAATFATLTQPVSYESFEYGWDANEGYFYVLGPSEAAVFSGQAFDDFETDWSANEDYLFAFGPGDLAAPEVDDFETDWSSNQDYAFSLPAATAAVFNGDAFEDFENVAAPVAFTVSPSANFLTTVSAHGRSNGDKVTVDSTGRLPAGLQPDTIYFVLSASPSALQLSLDNVNPVDISDYGTGVHRLIADKDLYWTTILEI